MELVYTLDGIAAAAGEVLEAIGRHRLVAFEGELGAGKTTLIQAICRRLGVRGTMSSPTFSIINEYEAEGRVIFHIDLYRCNSEEEAVRAGVDECIHSGNWCLVEWPSKAEGLFAEDTVRVHIGEIGAMGRKIIVNCKK